MHPRIRELKDWLKKLPTNKLGSVTVGSTAIPNEGVKKLQEEIDAYLQSKAHMFVIVLA